MPLAYTQPNAELARELREVARDALALETALAALNYELPSEFPEDQLVQITKSLAQLPLGTAEGCYPALAYARNRLPAIRREYVVSEEIEGFDSRLELDATPPLVRGTFVDECLRHLIASVTTALDEYRRLAAEEAPEEASEAGVEAAGEILKQANDQSLKLETGFDKATEELSATFNPASEFADNVKRQISDGQGLNRLARAELWMPKVIAGWCRQLVEALRQYPNIIRESADLLRVGIDIVEIGAERWHSFKHNQTTSLFNEIRATCDSFAAVADKLDERRRRRTTTQVVPPDEFNIEVARAMILVGRVPPPHWVPHINTLEFGTRRLRSLAPLAALTSLRSLTHVAARVSNLDPLANLTALESLDLVGTRVANLKPIGNLKNLRALYINYSFVRDLEPIANLQNLIRSVSCSDLCP